MLDPNDTNIALDRSPDELPSLVLAVFLISLTSVVFLLKTILNQLTVANTVAIPTHLDIICRNASFADVTYKNSLRKIRFIKCFKSKTSVLKSLLTKKNKHGKSGKVEQYVVHSSDIKAVLTKEKVNLMKTVQNLFEKVVGQPISTLLMSGQNELAECSELFGKTSNEKVNSSDSQINKQYRGKVVTWSSNLDDILRKVEATNKTVSEESSTASTLQSSMWGHTDLSSGISDVTVKVSQTEISSSKSFTTLFSKRITPDTSKSSLEQLDVEKFPSIEYFQVTLEKFQKRSFTESTLLDSTCSTLEDMDKASNSGEEKTSEYKERFEPLDVDKVSKGPEGLDPMKASSATEVPTKSPPAVDKSTKVSNAGDAQSVNGSSSRILLKISLKISIRMYCLPIRMCPLHSVQET
ncbi:hypothetical protein WDU94_007691 [Cyamophila willieti]